MTCIDSQTDRQRQVPSHKNLLLFLSCRKYIIQYMYRQTDRQTDRFHQIKTNYYCSQVESILSSICIDRQSDRQTDRSHQISLITIPHYSKYCLLPNIRVGRFCTFFCRQKSRHELTENYQKYPFYVFIFQNLQQV